MLFIFVFPVNADVQHDVQDGLYALGYEVKSDEKIGSKTTRAIKAFIDKNSFFIGLHNTKTNIKTINFIKKALYSSL